MSLYSFWNQKGGTFVKNISSMTAHCQTGWSTNSSAPVPSGFCLLLGDFTLPRSSTNTLSLDLQHSQVFHAAIAVKMLFLLPEMPSPGPLSA